MRVAERARRDARVLRLFLAGLSYREIGAVVGLRSPTSVGDIVKRKLSDEAGRLEVVRSRDGALFIERSEALLLAHWPRALQGDHIATAACLRVLDEQARFYGLYS
ncbi:hypothetical protein [Mycobacterium asiaticum]|uniref:hypothetical protein n=1 Tax=Mycobacterium asiaticum TaxID=1790 RepID=UPI00055A5AB1|nr:hypothetical protein [Mycobacterium asiaticum]ORA15561.1 hypothetical protein BST16_09120 [Mycobacterium asiaticum DSM 44297]